MTLTQGAGTIKFKHGGNSGSEGWPIVLSVFDPLLVQVPASCDIVSIEYETPAGSGWGSVTPGPIASSLGISATGPFATDFYVAEPGYKLFLLDIPEAHKVGGEVWIRPKLTAPISTTGTDQIKFLQTFTMTALNSSVVVYPPMDIAAPIDFALHSDPSQTTNIDFADIACEGPGGHRPIFDVRACDEWYIGTTPSLELVDLDPAMPASYIVGSNTTYFPGVPFGGLGCKAYITPDASAPLTVTSGGTASYPFPIANDPALVGVTLYWQGVQLTATNDYLLTPPLTVTIEP